MALTKLTLIEVAIIVMVAVVMTVLMVIKLAVLMISELVIGAMIKLAVWRIFEQGIALAAEVVELASSPTSELLGSMATKLAALKIVAVIVTIVIIAVSPFVVAIVLAAVPEFPLLCDDVFLLAVRGSFPSDQLCELGERDLAIPIFVNLPHYGL